MDQIIQEWERLVLPPEGAGGERAEQDPDGRTYRPVTAAPSQLKQHAAGIASYALPLSWVDPDSGHTVTRAGVIDIASSPRDTANLALAIYREASAEGLAASLAWTGTGSCQLWLFSDPVSTTTMELALARLKRVTGIEGQTLPGDLQITPLVPGFERGDKSWAYFYRADEEPSRQAFEIPPEEFWAHQVQVLRAIEPTPTKTLEDFSRSPGLGLGHSGASALFDYNEEDDDAGPQSLFDQPYESADLDAGVVQPSLLGIDPQRIDTSQPLAAAADQILAGLEPRDRPLIKSPFPYLDELLDGGFTTSNLYVVAMPPTGGFDALPSQIAEAAAGAGVPTAYVTFATSRDEMLDTAFARAAGLSVETVEKAPRARSPEEQAQLMEAVRAYLATTGTYLTLMEGNRETTPAELNDWIAVARARYDLGHADPLMLVIDDLAAMPITRNESANDPTLQRRVRTLKRLVRNQNVAIVAVIREDAAPSDQRGGTPAGYGGKGASPHILGYADGVIVLQLAPRRADLMLDIIDARLELVKNRGGTGRGSVSLVFEPAVQRFRPAFRDGIERRHMAPGVSADRA